MNRSLLATATGEPYSTLREVLQAPLNKCRLIFFIKHGKLRDYAWKHFVGLLRSFHYLS